MTESIKFDPAKLTKLNNPERLKILPPDLIWSVLNLKTPQIIVDIGAGTGFFALAFSEKIQDGKIYACDNSDEMVQWIQENISDKNIVPLKCSETSVNLPDETADLVYMMNVHHELLEPEKILIEVLRLLKPDGKIAIIDWKAEEMEQGPPLKIRIPENKITEQLVQAGFKDIASHNVLSLHSFITAEK